MLEHLSARGIAVEVVGGGTKRKIGRPVEVTALISTASLRGVSFYEPSELVMQVRAGTSLTQVETELASRNQMLAFEPIDPGPALGEPAGRQTIGAIFATNLSGSRRIAAGGARDHLLGIKAVNGRGELFQSGGRVMKNVTGLDLSRGLAGSWGTLAVLTEVTFKVLPRPEDSATLVYFGLPDDLAIELLCAAMATPFEVSGAVHLPLAMAARLEYPALRDEGKPVTAVRIENFPRATAYRKERLRDHLKSYGKAHILTREETLGFWGELRRLSILPDGASFLWRILTAPSVGPKLVDAIRRTMTAEAYYDWSGGLVWLEVPPSADAGASDIRRMVAMHGGHATLIRATAKVRTGIDVFPPLDFGVARLTRGLKAAFDPVDILNPGRMYANL